MTPAWPPTTNDLKTDLNIDLDDLRDDARLAAVLNAAVAFVEHIRPEFNYTDEPISDYPDPTYDLWLGTIRLAGRWHTRRHSPDGLIQMMDLGASRIPSFDPDIDRLLGIGKYRGPVWA